jgi:hypothetical protein
VSAIEETNLTAQPGNTSLEVTALESSASPLWGAWRFDIARCHMPRMVSPAGEMDWLLIDTVTT